MQGTFEESFSSVECQRGFPASPGPTEHKRWLGRFVFSTSELDPSADRRERKRPIGTYNVQSMAMLRLSAECFDILDVRNAQISLKPCGAWIGVESAAGDANRANI
ncbi:hypothetical protein CIHG_05333 [Coccidioides immitis H538.4]|uniref:Uncharacterized protein n=3 Tax=Coccidioides immitis TaxID=5501 RepID=A0A0J8R445_COCIT|nr:hypothetical protein CIRG_02113 [Coccidioides immitis RMSCC 2394]KMU79874.1 hypothetical protein CISG_07946 [Coccidioides immitis RMSCC 3703]KMU88162.1 hypothetical protein CIHG_05333 [Coccidioides immitis H538.4]